MSVRPFDRLTTRGRERRLRRMAVATLGRYPFDVARLRLLANDANVVYRVDTPDGTKYMLRITSPRTCHGFAETLAELEWLTALGRDTDLPVPIPVATRDRELSREVSVSGVPEARACSVFRWVAGPHLDDRMSSETARRFGELAARLHEHARSFRPRKCFRIRRHDRVFPWSNPDFAEHEPIVLFDREHRELLPPERRRVYERAIERVQRTIDDILAADEPDIVIHGDLHPWNVKVGRDGRLSPLDFEDLMWGRPVLDIATSLYYLELRENGRELHAAFRAGYERVAEWPERMPGDIDVLRAGRGLVLANWVLSSDEPGDREIATGYLGTIETRLRDWLHL